MNKKIYLNISFILFFLISIPILYRFLPDTFTQDKLEYFRSWYLYPRYVDTGLFENSIDFFLRLILFIFPNNLDLHEFSYYFGFLLATFFGSGILIMYCKFNLNKNSIQSSLNFLTFALLFYFFDRLFFDIIFNSSRSALCTLFISYFFVCSNKKNKVLGYLACLFIHFGLTILVICFELLGMLFRKFDINLRKFLIFSFIYFIINFIFNFNIFNQLINHVSIFIFNNDFGSRINFLGYQNLIRGFTISTNISISYFIQSILILSPSIFLIFQNYSDDFRTKLKNKIMLILGLILLFISDFYMINRVIFLVSLISIIIIYISDKPFLKKIIYLKIFVFIIVFLAKLI